MPSLMVSVLRLAHEQAAAASKFVRLTTNEIQPQYTFSLGCPSRNLDVHLIDIILVGQWLLILGRRLARRSSSFSLSRESFSLLSDFHFPFLQPLARLCLDDSL